MEQDLNIDRKKISEWIENTDSALIQQTESALEQFAHCFQLTPSTQVRMNILSTISDLNASRQNIDLKNPPLLSEKSNLLDWTTALKGIEPPNAYNDIHLEPIHQTDTVQLFVAWVRKMVPEEVHHDLLESFMILEGSCICHIKDINGKERKVSMKAGDYITMQIGDEHTIEVTSDKPTKAILQWLKVAA